MKRIFRELCTYLPVAIHRGDTNEPAAPLPVPNAPLINQGPPFRMPLRPLSPCWYYMKIHTYKTRANRNSDERADSVFTGTEMLEFEEATDAQWAHNSPLARVGIEGDLRLHVQLEPAPPVLMHQQIPIVLRSPPL